ncbi:hypothetical protein [Pseudoalteromonas denitrificans]|uniref:hypothetical protein n=1 Tax=Pseudoalteromonas denitrificans TaxID=43656 RepID=UPI000B82F528|nr:hypothetical protein [Pseudoalteromonas denitrificans]
MYQHKQFAYIIFVLLGWIASFVILALVLLGPNVPIILFAISLIVIGFIFHGLTIKVSDKDISWGFGPGVLGKKIKLSDIEQVKAVTNSFRHGIGIRITHDGWVYTVHGFSAVALDLKDGTSIRLGTNDQENLLTALNSRLDNN